MNLNEQIDRIKQMMGVLNEASQHAENLYKSWATKKSGNPEMAMKIMNDVLDNQKKLPKKDFSQYSSYDELVSDLNKIKESDKSKDVTVFYKGDMKNGDDLLVIAPNTWESSCEYGSSSKWCTTAKDTDEYWKRHNQTGTEFFWIFRSKPNDDPNHKFSYHIMNDGKTDWCNAINRCSSRLPENSYPLIHPMYEEIISKLNEFHNQRDNVINYSKRNEHQMVIVNWIHNNFEAIINLLNIEEIFSESLLFTIEDFIEIELEGMVPLEGDFHDEEYMEKYYNYMSDSLEKFKPQFDHGDFEYRSRIMDDLVHLVNNTPSCLEQIMDNTMTPESFVDILERTHENDLNEIVNENVSTYVYDLVSDEASGLSMNF